MENRSTPFFLSQSRRKISKGGEVKKLCMILPLALILCFMVGCQDKETMAELEAFKAQAAVEVENVEVVKNIFKEIDKKNFDVYDELYAEDCIGHFPPHPDSTREDLKQSAIEAYVEMPDYTHTIEDIIAKGDKVVVRLTNRGTVKASGKKVEFPVILIGQIVNGKIVEVWGMVDFLGKDQQIGMELKPKKEK